MTDPPRASSSGYETGIKPDWWKLECQANKTAWDNIARVIESGDPLCRGALLLGLEAPEKDLAQAFALAHNCGLLKASQWDARSLLSRRWSGSLAVSTIARRSTA
jgi:myo-inositol catabolism protein IolC